MNFTYLDHDAVNFGSTAFRIWDDELTIFIEAFPNVTACDWDPETISDADIIIQNVHGHLSHYDADECATVALNTGAYVVGNSQLKSDMTARGVSSNQIIELSPNMGGKVTKTIPSLGVSITAYGMDHTMMSGTKVDTYLVEMPNGLKFYHGTCSSETSTYNYMDNHNELDYLDVMILDTDVFGDTNPNTRWNPETLIKDHDFNSASPIPATIYENYPTTHSILYHNDTYKYTRPDYLPRLSSNSVTPSSGDPFTDFTFSVEYIYRPNNEPTKAKIVIDDVEYEMIKGSGEDFREGVTYSFTTKLPSGVSQYHYEFEVDDKPVRLKDTGEFDGPEVNALPFLNNELVDPVEGDDETDFTFSVTYNDEDGDFAIERSIFIDDEKSTMSTKDSDPVSGMNYTFTTRLSIGSHSYYYQFSDGKNQVRYPEEGVFSIPEVNRANYPPVLSMNDHDPPTGHRQTEFTFGIKYRDSHGDEPVKKIIVLDGLRYNMTPMGTNFVKGVTFVFRSELGLGNHEYHFEFSDQDFEVRYPSEDGIELTGPMVENRVPLPEISHPAEFSEFPDDIPILLDASNSSDIDGDDLNYTWTSDIDGELGIGPQIHVILSEGQHMVTLEVSDGFGGISTSLRSIFVVHFEAVINIDMEIDPEDPEEGEVVTATTSMSNSGNLAQGPMVLTFYLDGISVRSHSIDGLGPGARKNLEATLTPGPGDHELKVIIEDMIAVYHNFSVIERTPPIAIAGDDISVELGEDVVLDGSPSIYHGALILIEWNMDDGTKYQGFSVEHLYTSAGVYNATLTLEDDLGKRSTDTVMITVTDPFVEVPETKDEGGSNGDVVMIVVILLFLILVIGLIIGSLLILKKRNASQQDQDLTMTPPSSSVGQSIERLPKTHQMTEGYIDSTGNLNPVQGQRPPIPPGI